MNFSKIAFVGLFFSFFSLVQFSCTRQKKELKEKTATDSLTISIPAFNADSAYRYIQAQVDFGPRTPNSKAHEKCGDYLLKEMTRFGGQITVQKTDLMGWDGKVLKARNIITSFNTEKTTRILFLAHWDCRPWSDHDPNPANHKKPVLGANDAASGVGVLMEVARQLQIQKPRVGVDILFVDMEDYGEPEWYEGQKTEESWCLGSQYWAKNPHVPGYRARYGILLDMVGVPNATFPKEQHSMYYAPHVVEKVWNEATANGFDTFFVNKQGGGITDDHLPINQIIGIPTIDIIHYDENGFGDFWHTQNDTMENIDKTTLKAVGQTLLGVIYKEKE